MSKKEIVELSKIGKKIHEAYTSVIESITLEEVKKFADYLQEQETIMPLFDPIKYMGSGGVMLGLARMRVRALRAFFEEAEPK